MNKRLVKPETNNSSKIYGFETGWKYSACGWYCDIDGDPDGVCVQMPGWRCYWNGSACNHTYFC